MGKIKGFFRDLSLKKSIIAYISLFAFTALLLSALTSTSCNILKTRIYDSYPVPGEKYYLTSEDGERLGEGTYIYKQEKAISEKDMRLICLLEFIPLAAVPVYSVLSVIMAALLFYRNKLKVPLAKLEAASEKIAYNDLDFQINYYSGDEMGRLCASFELMRRTLAENFSRMWRQMEERRQLNAAFAHDLRTPLTVLKGYDEMLLTSPDPAARDTALTMGRQISRLERYVDSMSGLSRLEDTEPAYETCRVSALGGALKENAELLCLRADKKLSFYTDAEEESLCLDRGLIFQVCDNLLSNAVRYAESRVALGVQVEDGGLLLTVSDDGEGFSGEALRKAQSPYFSGEEDRAEHFGLGLYICALLCRKHGGRLRLGNTARGAEVIAFFAPGR